MAGSGFGRLLVVEGSKLIGILSQRDIMRLFEFKSEIERG
jgi:CBS domain-containing protein